MIDKGTIDRIFAAADIVEVVSDFITLRKKGANYTACCPFHSEKTPSFMVSPAKGLYKCFGCSKGGGAINFVMEHEKLSYPEALKWMARKYGIEIEEKSLTAEEQARNNDRESMLVLNSWADGYFARQLFDSQSGRDIGLSYFKERGFNEATIKKFSLGYAPEGGANNSMTLDALKDGYKEEFLTKTGLTILRDSGENSGRYYDRFCGRVIFPIHSLAGRVVGFGGRTMRSDKKTAKYLNSPQSEIYDKSHTLYGIFFAKKSITTLDKCILVEGYTDVMQMHQLGIENVVASSGTSLTEQQIKLIARFTRNVTVIYDGDSAGIKASLRGVDMILAAGLNVRVVPLPIGDDPDSFARNHSLQEVEAYIDHNEEDFLSFKTRILLDGAGGDPIERARLINDIVASIAVIPDNITREVYINECARLMDISVDVLSRSVASAMVKSQLKPQRASTAQNEGSSPATNTAAPEQAPIVATPTSTNVKRLEQLELELLSYLLKYGGETFKFDVSVDNQVELPVAGTIIDELTNDNIAFVNPFYRSIFDEYNAAYKGGNTPSIAHFLSHERSEIASLAADIASHDERYVPSAMWERYEMSEPTERETLGETIPKTIVIYKSAIIAAQIEELKAVLAVDLDSFDAEVIGKIQQLDANLKAINFRYLRLI